ncbi:MAG: hypothetical protein ACKVK0_03390 [Pirellulales bacterium]
MDSLEFECPLCNGLFNAAATDVEVTCPHCDEKICLGSFEAVPSTNVILVAKPIVTPVPLFPPGYRNTTATDSSVSPTTVREESLPVVIIDDGVAESLVGTDTDTAIDDLLPPGFQLDDVQIERDTDLHETTEATVVIDVRVDREPLTVGRGINERELRNRTPDEKNQFMRKKNVIVWGIGALIIIVTMIVMLQLS